MNCHELEPVLTDLARGQMIDASLREKAIAHAKSCSGCEARLADERALVTGLQFLAASTETQQAPERIEASLVAAFREQHAASSGSASRRVSVTTRPWLYIAASVAAAAVFVLLLTVIASRPNESKNSAPQKAEGAPAPPQSATPERPKPAPLTVSASGVERGITSGIKGGTKRIDNRRKRVRDSDRATTYPEIRTDFFPLVNRESLSELDSAQVVRVELPRSALMSFGLPMNMERANERIKADVVLGNDGLARAIRFVR